MKRNCLIKKVAEIVKKNPFLYDYANMFKRRILNKHDEIYLFLNNLSRQKKDQLYFIQIGSNDGIRNDPLREFIINFKWSGILVEPLPNIFEELKKNYSYKKDLNLKFINAAISDENTNLKFYTFAEEFLNKLNLEERLDYLRKSSFYKKHLENVIRRTGKGSITFSLVPCFTYNFLINKFADKPIDLLVIDAEGHEARILYNINYKKNAPEVILFESHNLGKVKYELYSFLLSQGYIIKTFNGDSVAISDKMKNKI